MAGLEPENLLIRHIFKPSSSLLVEVLPLCELVYYSLCSIFVIYEQNLCRKTHKKVDVIYL
jgi:hypothetical protein